MMGNAPLQKGKFIIIGRVINDTKWLITPEPATHETNFEANVEAERLAKKYPNTEYTVVQICGTVVLPNTPLWK